MQRRPQWGGTLALALLLCGAPTVRAADDIVFADFEGNDYGAWRVEGTAFGTRPAPGTLPGQMVVEGFQGHRLVNSYNGGDDTRGKLTSPDFIVNRKFIAFLIGGGGWDGKTCMNLVVDGKVVRTSTGPNTAAGGSERLEPSGWDVSELAGKTAHIEIVDEATGGWGHINVDNITFTDTKPPIAAKLLTNVSRDITAANHWLLFPVKNGAKMRNVTINVDGKVVRHFEIELADAQPDWWAPLDVRAWRGHNLAVTVNQLPDNSHGLEQVTQSDTIPGTQNLYHEALRPQFHFSAQRGWLNDPNGLSFFNGEYHLFFQHSPFSWGDAMKHWGQAVSRDLVHWQEVDEALYPDEFGAMWSGSGAVDWKNTSGFGKNGQEPLVLIYTAAGNPFTQCIAYSTDGRNFTKYAGNPVIQNVTGGNRDPRVFWYAPTQHWVTALYVEKDGHHTIHFYTSPNLRDWTLSGITQGGANGDNFLYECPDIFELPLDGDPNHKKWILTAANTEYAVGSFDGKQFTPETTKLPGERGRGFYAPQTFNDGPKGRRVQIGWMQTATGGMPFNQSMSLPIELRLISTPDGPRLTWMPVQELESLRTQSHALGALTLREGDANPLAALSGELLEIRCEFEPGDANEIAFNVRGVPIIFNAKQQELIVNGHHAPAPLRNGKQNLTIYVDRTSLEVFASDGLTYVPMPINLNPAEKSLSVAAHGGTANFSHLDVHELRSAWNR